MNENEFKTNGIMIARDAHNYCAIILVSTCQVQLVCEAKTMVFSLYVKQKILFHHFRGQNPHTIECLLRHEGLKGSRQGIG